MFRETKMYHRICGGW